jgi:hypothetical protein
MNSLSVKAFLSLNSATVRFRLKSPIRDFDAQPTLHMPIRRRAAGFGACQRGFAGLLNEGVHPLANKAGEPAIAAGYTDLHVLGSRLCAATNLGLASR